MPISISFHLGTQISLDWTRPLRCENLTWVEWFWNWRDALWFHVAWGEGAHCFHADVLEVVLRCFKAYVVVVVVDDACGGSCEVFLAIDVCCARVAFGVALWGSCQRLIRLYSIGFLHHSDPAHWYLWKLWQWFLRRIVLSERDFMRSSLQFGGLLHQLWPLKLFVVWACTEVRVGRFDDVYHLRLATWIFLCDLWIGWLVIWVCSVLERSCSWNQVLQCGILKPCSPLLVVSSDSFFMGHTWYRLVSWHHWNSCDFTTRFGLFETIAAHTTCCSHFLHFKRLFRMLTLFNQVLSFLKSARHNDQLTALRVVLICTIINVTHRCLFVFFETWLLLVRSFVLVKGQQEHALISALSLHLLRFLPTPVSSTGLSQVFLLKHLIL